MNKSYTDAVASALKQISEAIRPQDFKKSETLILQYIKKNGFSNIVQMPGYEPFKNANEIGIGIRYFYGAANSVRINWAVNSTATSNIRSADIWLGDGNLQTGGGSDIHIDFGKQISLVKALPSIVSIMHDPKVGTEYIFENVGETLLESAASVLTENAINVKLDVAQKFVDQLEDGKKIVEILKAFGGAGVKILNRLKELYPNSFEKRGVAVFFVGSNSHIDIDAVLGSAGGVKVTVTKGPSVEKVSNTAAETQLEKDGDRLVFEEQLKDLESVTKLLISGAAYSMFVAGKGGVGKTYTLEKVLHAAGKTDGDGYFKISGSGSPIGLYKALYQNRTGIVLVDDADSLLDSQEARNLIKAATDTKKERKLNWMKKGGKEFYDPSVEDGDDENGDSEEERTPTNFIFTGKFIMITNLPMNKLDPDGALRTRSFVVNIDPTDLELVEYMSKLAPSIQLEDGLSLSLEERKEVTDLIKSMVGKRTGLSLRNLVRGLNIRASGISNWADIIKRYA